jgi:hypothetical protein
MEQMYTCPNCGEIVYYGEPSCRNCGMELDWTAVETNPPQDDYQDYDQQQWDQQQWDQQQWDQQQQEQQQWQPPAEQSRQTGYRQNYPPGKRTRLTGVKKVSRSRSFKDYIDILRKRKKLVSVVVLSILCVIIAATAIAFGLGANPFAPADNGVQDNTPAPSDNTPAVTPVSGPIDIVKFVVNPPVIPSGQTSTLSWEVKNASLVSIDQGIGEVPPSGQQVISPDETTTYKLTATNDSGSETALATISVNISAPVVNFTATPSTIAVGGKSVLKWDVKGAKTIQITGIDSVEASGTHEVQPSTTTTYTLTATNSAGVTTATAKVSIGSSGAPVIVSFDATPDFIDEGESSTLEWYVTNADSVAINRNVGAVATRGSATVEPTFTTTYTMTASNSAGTSTMSVTVTISTDGRPVVTSFYPTPPFITTGGSSTLTWEVAGADTIFIDPGIGAVDASGTEVVMPDVTTTYTLSATNTNGTTTATATVTFSQVPPPVITFTADPTTMPDTYTAGSTLTWSVTGGEDSFTIDNGIGDVSASGTLIVHPTVSTDYTLTVYKQGIAFTKTIRVSVYEQ